MANNNYFYDIHCHAMNFSHPNLFAFVKRKWTIAMLASPFAPIAQFLFKDKVKKAENLVSLMENDLADFFLIMEYFLKNHPEQRLIPSVGNNNYNKIVLTPLMMDFGCKDIRSNSFYNIAPQKPIVEQVIDVFDGIKKYCNCELIKQGDDVEYIPKKKQDKLFEIYPFLGLNTKNYTPEKVQDLLDKYFAGYTRSKNDLYTNMGEFNGDIDSLGSNYFAGIKVYPPLGFDPWPANDQKELEKVKLLYQRCCDKKIPITTHCSEGGFAIHEKAEEYTSPMKWKAVLANTEYRELRLNFAHFGRQDNKWYGARNYEWQNIILNLIQSYDNIYADFAYRGCDSRYYYDLIELLSNFEGDKDKLMKRILFGSDFMINLMDIDSYNEYLRKFTSSENPIADEQKHLFCSINPGNFLFG